MKRPLSISVKNEGGKAIISIIGLIADYKESAQVFASQVQNLVDQGVKDCELYIRSEGGNVFEANDIVNVIKTFPGTITGKGGALVASAATYIAIACKTFSMPMNGVFMIHKPEYAPYGNVDEIEADLKMLKILTSDYCKAYATKTGLTEAQVEQMWKENCWMSAEEACEKKFIDSISEEEEPVDQVMLESVKAIYKNVPTALLKSPTIIHPNSNDTMDKKTLCVVLALAETISDAEVLAAISGMKAKADKADELLNQVNALKAERDATKISNLLDDAVKNKQITATERPHFEKVAKSDFATAEALIKARPAVNAISGQMTPEGTPAPEDRTGWKYDDYQKKDPEALVKMAADELPKFKQLFKAHYGQDYEG